MRAALPKKKQKKRKKGRAGGYVDLPKECAFGLRTDVVSAKRGASQRKPSLTLNRPRKAAEVNGITSCVRRRYQSQ
jgi:hypothetical protein